MTIRYTRYCTILLIGILSLLSCNRSVVQPADAAVTVNSKAAQKQPYLILVSLDGFRWDYVEKYRPPHLSAFIAKGVRAASLIPSFPSKTFPNHYTIATGMYPDKHGIVDNSFYSYKKELTYRIGDRKMVEDGTFYGGTPIWVQASKAGMVSASYFFVGSEADVQGIRPTYYHKYDGKVKNEARVAGVLEWLKLPEKERPHLITMYFSDMDDTGHRFGPDNEAEIKKALFDLDEHLGELFKGVQASGLPVNIIIVSDHGMANVAVDHLLPIEAVQDDSLFLAINNGTTVHIHPKEGISVDAVIRYLQQKENHFKVYPTAQTPGFEYLPQNKDWGPIQLVPEFGYYFSNSRSIATHKQVANTVIGVHGYAPGYQDMHGIFYAGGPAFKKGYAISSIKNIHLYPLMCRLLGLKIPADIDGDLNQVREVLNGG